MKQYSHINSISLITLTGLAFLSTPILVGSAVHADNTDVVDEINITVPSSCSMTGTGMNSHNDDIANGIYKENIGTTTLKAFCNDNAGFAINATGFTGDEVGGENSDKLVGNAASGNAIIESGIATTAGNPDISNWAMKLTKLTDSGDTADTNAFTIDSAPNTDGGEAAPFTNYHVVPNEYTKVAHKDTSTSMDETTGGVSLTTTYAAYISKTQPAGTYSGKVKYTLVHPATAVPETPISCNPAGTTIGTNTNTDIKCMQDFANMSDTQRNTIIASMTPEQQYTLKDIRDGKEYTIAKYQTGTNQTTSEPIYDVWMTKNLDLDLDASRTYTNEDTDLGYNTTTDSYGTASWTPTRSTYAPTSDQIHEWCQGGTRNSGGYCENNDTPESYDPGDLYWNLTESDWSDWNAYYNSCDYSTSTLVCDQSKNPINTYTSSTGTTQYHLGNYYNWAAALATNDSSAFNSSTIVEQSICPAGWTLPRISNGEDTFYSLWNQYGFASSSYNDTNSNNAHDANEDALWTSPLYFVAGGGFDGNLGDVGDGDHFRTPIPDGSSSATGAYFDTGGYVSPSGYFDRVRGNSVRCILRPVVGSWSDGGGGGEG